MDVIPNTIRKQLKPPKKSSASEYLQPAKKTSFLNTIIIQAINIITLLSCRCVTVWAKEAPIEIF